MGDVHCRTCGRRGKWRRCPRCYPNIRRRLPKSKATPYKPRPRPAREPYPGWRGLVADWHGPVARYARGLAARYRGDADEFESAAALSLVLAARAYRPALGGWEGYLWRRVGGAVRDAARNDRPKGYRRSADRPTITPFVGDGGIVARW